MNFFICMCDESHSWKLDKNLDEIKEDDKFCPYGHYVVTMEKYTYVDDAVITFRPAGCFKPLDNNNICERGKYYIIISNMESNKEKISVNTYWWKEAVEIAQKFDKRSFAEGLKFWDMWKL